MKTKGLLVLQGVKNRNIGQNSVKTAGTEIKSGINERKPKCA